MFTHARTELRVVVFVVALLVSSTGLALKRNCGSEMGLLAGLKERAANGVKVAALSYIFGLQFYPNIRLRTGKKNWNQTRDIIWKNLTQLQAEIINDAKDISLQDRGEIFHQMVSGVERNGKLRYHPLLHPLRTVNKTKTIYDIFDAEGKIDYRNNPHVKARSQEALVADGTSTGGSPHLGSWRVWHRDAMKEFAKFTGQDDSLMFASSDLAFGDWGRALVHKGDLVLVSHDSDKATKDGVRDALELNGKVDTKRPHRGDFDSDNLKDLEEQIESYREKNAKGNIVIALPAKSAAQLRALNELGEKYGRISFVINETKTLGKAGPNGRGLLYEAGLNGDPKFMLVAGMRDNFGTEVGFIAGGRHFMALNRYLNDNLKYSATSPPPTAGATLGMLELANAAAAGKTRIKSFRVNYDLTDEIPEFSAGNGVVTRWSPARQKTIYSGIHGASNSSLGLDQHPYVISQVFKMIEKHGPAPLKDTEAQDNLGNRIAHEFGAEAGVTFPTGFTANQAGLDALVGPRSLVAYDASVHASTINGMKGVSKFRAASKLKEVAEGMLTPRALLLLGEPEVAKGNEELHAATVRVLESLGPHDRLSYLLHYRGFLNDNQSEMANYIRSWMKETSLKMTREDILEHIEFLLAKTTPSRTDERLLKEAARSLDEPRYFKAGFGHNDIAQLKRRVEEFEKVPGMQESEIFVVMESHYSMDDRKSIVPDVVNEILAKHPRVVLVVDDAHGVGPLGKNGFGTLSTIDPKYRDRVVILGTQSKALAGQGGFAIGSYKYIARLKKALRQDSSYTQPMVNSVAAHSAIDIMKEQGDQYRDYLQNTSQVIRKRLRDEAGLDVVVDTENPILMLKGRFEASDMSSINAMVAKMGARRWYKPRSWLPWWLGGKKPVGGLVTAVQGKTVGKQPGGIQLGMIRINLNANLSPEQIDHLVSFFSRPKIKKHFKLDQTTALQGLRTRLKELGFDVRGDDSDAFVTLKGHLDDKSRKKVIETIKNRDDWPWWKPGGPDASFHFSTSGDALQITLNNKQNSRTLSELVDTLLSPEFDSHFKVQND